MKILFVGYSNLIRRRILPFINEIKGISSVEIAKYHDQRNEVIPEINMPLNVFNSYEEAFEKTKAEIAYISTVNSAHDFWCEKALMRGMHVIVDKPAFMNYARAFEVVNLSEKLNLSLAEATVYSYHSQFSTVFDFFSREHLKPTGVTINFSFPDLDPGNFRYQKSLGGGALNDLGPYAVSAGREFYNDSPLQAHCIINSYKEIAENEKVETSFSILLQYSNGRSLAGQFGFNSEYINRILVSGENFSCEINRAFTPPHDQNNEIMFRMKNQTRILNSGLSNSFVNFMNSFIRSIGKSDTGSFKKKILQDAEALDLIRKNVF